MLVPDPGLPAAEQLYQNIQEEVDAEHSWVLVTLNLWIEPNGRIVECSIGKVGGEAKFAKPFCPMLKGLVIGSPSDEMGRPTFALVSFSTSAFSDTAYLHRKEAIAQFLPMANATDPDYELAIPGRPISNTNFFLIDISIRADGTVSTCEKTKQRKNKVTREIANAGCALAQRKTFAIRHDTNGQAVSYVRSVKLVSGG